MIGRRVLVASLVAISSSAGAANTDEWEAARREIFGPGPELAAAETSVPEGSACALTSSYSSDAADTRECLRCHGGAGGGPVHGNHPVDLDYGVAAARAGGFGGLRSPGEVLKRGVFLPEGRLHCVTCHDARSPWKARIALPPGAMAFRAVDPRDPSTYEGGASWRTRTPSQPAPPEGSAVSPAPLCIACHALD